MTLNQETLMRFAKRYEENPQNLAAEHAVQRNGIEQAAFNNQILRKHSFVFSDETKRGKITSQKSSGRCWMFASLNVARVEVMQRLNLETFEFSQNYTFFWDKLEKANFFLDSILDTLDEEQDSRLLKHLLKDPVQDGGQWDMFAGLLKKYGAVPKSVMPETFHSSNSSYLVNVLTKCLRQDACTLRKGYAAGMSREALIEQKEEMLFEIYTVLTKALGRVPERFTWSYRDKEKVFHRLPEMTPQEFFETYVGWDLDARISLIHAPTTDKPYGRAYTVQYLGTVKEAKPVRYVNVPMERLKQAAIRSIQAGEPVWYGCDVGQFLARQEGIMDESMFDLESVLGVKLEMTKAERLDYSESLLTHAMVLVGVDLDDSGKPLTWKVENSWGEDRGDKGIFSMSDAWMDEYTYQIMVDRKYVEEQDLAAYDGEVTELKPWDPMGSLAWLR